MQINETEHKCSHASALAQSGISQKFIVNNTESGIMFFITGTNVSDRQAGGKKEEHLFHLK